VSRTSTHKIKPTPHFNKLQLPELLDVQNVQINTDGACKDGKMGSAAVFEITGQNEPIVVMTQPTKSNPSANKA
jgi:hypothetical protein